MRKIRQGGNGKPRQPWKREPPLTAAANLHHHTEKNTQWKRYLPSEMYLPAHPHMTEGREEREQESVKIRQHKAKVIRNDQRKYLAK